MYKRGGGAVCYNEIVALVSRWRKSDKKSTHVHVGCATHKLRTLRTLTCTRWALENTLEIFITNFAGTG